MAEGRLVNKRIGMDKAVGRLSNDTCRLAFTWTLPHLDRDGRVTGDPAALRSLVFPRRDDISSEAMKGFIGEWAREELVIWYEAAGDLWLEFPAFRKNQPNLRHDREPVSSIPPAKTGNPVSFCIQEAGPVPVQVDTGNPPEERRQDTGNPPGKEGSIEGRNEAEGMNEIGKMESDPPPAAPAGLERPAGPPAPSDAAPEDPEPERVIPLDELPPELRTAIRRRERQAPPGESIASTPPDPQFLAATKPRASPDPAGDDFEDGPPGAAEEAT